MCGRETVPNWCRVGVIRPLLRVGVGFCVQVDDERCIRWLLSAPTQQSASAAACVVRASMGFVLKEEGDPFLQPVGVCAHNPALWLVFHCHVLVVLEVWTAGVTTLWDFRTAAVWCATGRT